MAEFTEDDLIKALALIKAKKETPIVTLPNEDFEEDQIGTIEQSTIWLKEKWSKLTISIHFHFLKLLSIISVLILLSAIFPKIIVRLFPNMNADLGTVLQRGSQSAVIAFCGFVFMYFALYLTDNVFYKYIGRNGDRIFDLQENFRELSNWQKIQISSCTRIAYLLYYALCYAAT